MIEQIEAKIHELLEDFKQYPDKYLTESDVRCFLFNKLLELEELAKDKKTKDDSYSIPLHTEIRWYGKSGKLKWRSDMVVIDVSSLRVRDTILKLPSKGYGFNEPLVIIEIKLRRANGNTDNAFIKKLQEDISKLQKIKREIPGDYPCYLIVLDKKRDIREKIGKIDSIKIRYEYSKNNP